MYHHILCVIVLLTALQDHISGTYHPSIKYPHAVDFGLLLRECRHCRPSFVKFPWKPAGHVCSNSSKCRIPNSVALFSVL